MRPLIYAFILVNIVSLSLYYCYKIYSRIYNVCSRPIGQRYIAKRIYGLDYLKKKYKFKEVSFESEDNVKLSGFIINRPNAKRVVAIFHGYRQSKEQMYPWIDLFENDNDTTLCIIDFRAHGSSQGNLISLGCHESKDIKSTINFLKNYKDTKTLDIYAIGISMGAVALIKAVSEGIDVKAIILDSAFANLKKQIEYGFRKITGLPKSLSYISYFLFNLYLPNCFKSVKPYKLIKNIDIPIFIIHMYKDKVTPSKCANILFKNINNNTKEIWIPKGEGHIKACEIFKKEYKEKICNFLNKY